MTASRNRQRGFTLLELMVAVAVLAGLATGMAQVIAAAMAGSESTHERLRRPKVANAIFSQIFRDFRYIYWGGIKGNAGFRGKANQLSGHDADSVQFITARLTRTTALEEGEQRRGEEPASPLTEVGYALRVNDEEPQYLELWRREDAFVDSKPTHGGTYTLVYSRITSFRLRYYPSPSELPPGKGEGFETWDSATRGTIPYAILIEVRFDVVEDEEGDRRGRKQKETDKGHIWQIIRLRGGEGVPYESTTSEAGGGENSGR